MEEKYDPNYLLTSVATLFEAEGKNFFVVSNEDIVKYKIEIEIKDSAKKYTIAMAQKGRVLLLEGAEISGRIKNHDDLEKNKDKLGEVKIFINNKEKMKVKSFEDFCEKF